MATNANTAAFSTGSGDPEAESSNYNLNNNYSGGSYMPATLGGEGRRRSLMPATAPTGPEQSVEGSLNQDERILEEQLQGKVMPYRGDALMTNQPGMVGRYNQRVGPDQPRTPTTAPNIRWLNGK